jgi:hypothetical protein
MSAHRNAPAFRLALTAGLAAVVVTAVVGCGTSKPSTQASGPATAATSAAPAPIPTEVSPPGDVPDNQTYVTFTATTSDYSLQIPEGWAKQVTGTVTSFTDKLNSVAIERAPTATAPTVASVKAKEVAALAASKSKFSLTSVRRFTRSGGSGIQVVYLTDSAPNSVTGAVIRDAVELYLFWKSGRQVAVTLTSPQGADNVDPWAKITGSYQWLK